MFFSGGVEVGHPASFSQIVIPSGKTVTVEYTLAEPTSANGESVTGAAARRRSGSTSTYQFATEARIRFSRRNCGARRGADVRALDGVSLTVPEGTCMDFLGPNGAGKTTMVGSSVPCWQRSRGRCHRPDRLCP